MRTSKMLGRTLRDAPSEADADSHKLLTRAGFVRQLAAGIFDLLPLGQRTFAKIKGILREEMERIGGQEVLLPVVHPAEIWKATGRYYEAGEEQGRFNDRTGREMVLAMTHEEAVAHLVRTELRSYRQLPCSLFQIQTKWRDTPRPRGALIGLREFTMADSYSLDADLEGLERQYRNHYEAYMRIFSRCALPVKAAASDAAMRGGRQAHEFIYPAEIGEDTIVVCDQCGYAANRGNAVFRRIEATAPKPEPMEMIETPGITTIDALAAFLSIPPSRTAKAVFMVATVAGKEQYGEKFVFAVIRGDLEVNEAKLANAVKARALRPALEEEITAAGAQPGYGSPVGLKDGFIVADESITASANLVAGANKPGFHLLNVNAGRDFEPDLVCDLAVARQGDPCSQCEGILRTFRGVALGSIFQLGTRYSEALGCTFLDGDGQARPIVMGSYGIGLERLLACIAEEHHDEDGLVWPLSVAPFQVHLVSLLSDNQEPTAQASRFYQDLVGHGFDVLFDDRPDSAGVKFKDADLVGIPLRLTLSSRSLDKGGVELKKRSSKERAVLALNEVCAALENEIAAMKDALRPDE